ncbi:PKD domain-containing protein [Flavobacterium cerinum]|uniref:PKD domain-containing protein n=1 Tax=Flavobacterium cerinum TaxID=2502784 RepID=A0A444H8T9_9FLAO|nr:PKD domain-containing protein [Flavobacterium cerinum]RWW99588.1 PKD domain-containing protein [Flavobacterium cerinum]
MKRHLTQRRKRLKFVLGCLFWLMMFNNLNAQNITLTWDKESGCQVYKPREKEDFNEDIGSGNCVRVCENSSATYTVNNSNSAWPTVWTVTGGTISGPNNGTSCLVNWGSSGFGFVSVTVTTPNGPRTKEMCLEIITGPKPNFVIVPGQKEFCLEETIYFTNTSSANGGSQIISYFWDFGDKTYSSEFEPTHIYTKPGKKTVILTVTNECNCSRTYEMEINILDTKAYPITCNSVVCENGTDDYSIPEEVAKKCDGHNNWKVEGGTILSPMPYGATITVRWDNVDSTGFGYVIYDGNECGLRCAQIAIKVPVVTSKTKIVGESIVCANTQYRYKLPQWPTTDFVWSIVSNGTGATIMNTDQRNEVIVTTGTEGDITLRCTYRNSMLKCGGFAEYKIRVKAMGIISGPIEVCQNTTQTYSVNNGYVGTWTLKKPNNSTVTFPGNSFSYLFNVPGKYTLSVTGNDFCPPSEPFIIRVDPIPAAPTVNDIVGPAKVCTASPVEYRLTNTVPGTVLVWEAINGTISGSNYGEAVTVEFTPGFASYGVRVWRENTAEPHCISAKTTKIVTEHVVTLNITTPVNPVCASSVNGYSVAYSEGEVYEWSVSPATAGSVATGNGTSSVGILWNQLVVPNTQVVLKVRKCNVWHTTSLPVNVILSPAISITNVPTSVCPDVNVTPTISPALTSGTVTWNFGDGTPTVTLPVGQPLPPHQYSNVAISTTYTITVVVENPNGCITPATAVKSITVNPAPVALITPDTHRIFCNTVTPFTLTVTIQSGLAGTALITWYNGNTILSSGPNNYNLPVTGFGDYRAWVENPNGCGQYTNTIRVINDCGGSPGCIINPAPSVTMDATQGGCNVVAATSVTTPAPVSFGWSAGPEATVVTYSQNSASFSYQKAGNYTIIYEAIYMDVNNQPCRVSRIDSQIIPYIPKINYSVSCSSSGSYTITVTDNSNYYPNTPPTSKIFTIGLNQYTVAPTATSYTVTVPPGNYNLGITLGRSGFLTCSDFASVNLPAMPNSAITSPSTTCDGTGFQLSPTAGVVPGLYYNWNFGDGSSNLQPQPVKVYGSSGTKTVSLTVSNIYGCSSTSSVNVNVAPNQLNGNLTSTSPNCEGDPIIITYNSTGTAPSTYTWMKDQTVIATGTPSIQVTSSGSYWVTVGNSIGCIKPIPTTPAKFIMSPDPAITGPDGVCVNQSFKLSGYAGAGNLQYRWLRNGSQIATWSSSALLNYSIPTPGTSTFTVEVRVPDGSGGYCISSANYLVTAYSLPQSPQLTYTVVKCNPYTVKLNADAGTPGTYTWSNGGTGSDITVNKGGPFMVTFTNPGGCTSTNQFDVPKDPEEYFWIFPKGCYEFCMNSKTGEGAVEILGPAPQAIFGKWIWLKDFSMDQGGVNSVPNYTISQSGTYQMGLLNGICYKETENMEVKVTDCRCELKMDLKDVKADTKPFCHFLVHLYIDNPYGYPIDVTVGAGPGQGIFIPSVVTVPPGGSGFDLDFIPTGYVGGTSMEIILTTTLEDGVLCRTREKFVFPRCDSKPQGIINPDSTVDNVDAMAKLNSLVVAPNPSSDVTGLTYIFANEKAMSRSIEIYSLMGVLLETHTPEAQEGKWTVNLGRYAAGQYIVVMREDGVSVAQKAIIKE